MFLGSIRADSEAGQDDQRAGAEAESSGLVQPEEEKALGRTYRSSQYQKRAFKNTEERFFYKDVE